MIDNNVETRQRALLIGLDTGEYDAELSLDELEQLADTAGADTVGKMIQKRPAPDSATCIGSGRLAEAALMVLQEYDKLTQKDVQSPEASS